MDSSPLIFVLYDSVTNSVFEGQVKNLLHTLAHKNPYQPIHLVSFERNPQEMEQVKNISITYLKRMPFLGAISIWYATHQLKSFLRTFPEYSIIARGPLAALIAQRSIRTEICKQFIVQARGLLAQEYAYTHTAPSSWWSKLRYRLRLAQLHKVELRAYGDMQRLWKWLPFHSKRSIKKTIEAVSPALRNYLIDTFYADKENIILAQHDIPKPITPEQKTTWRTEVRTQLGIPADWIVYCYNGSGKKWQKPDDIIAFFKERLNSVNKVQPASSLSTDTLDRQSTFNHLDRHAFARDDEQRENASTSSNVFLLLLTTDTEPFQQLLGTIPAQHYHIATVKHGDIYRYLAAADYGLLFRDAHVINWVSRPTKALEYRAAHLEIIHNNTVDYLNNLDNYITNVANTPVQTHKITDLDYLSDS